MGVTVCSKCYRHLAPGDDTCPQCGRRMRPPPLPRALFESGDAPPRSIGWAWMLGTSLLAAAVVVATNPRLMERIRNWPDEIPFAAGVVLGMVAMLLGLGSLALGLARLLRARGLWTRRLAFVAPLVVLAVVAAGRSAAGADDKARRAEMTRQFIVDVQQLDLTGDVPSTGDVAVRAGYLPVLVLVRDFRRELAAAADRHTEQVELLQIDTMLSPPNLVDPARIRDARRRLAEAREAVREYYTDSRATHREFASRVGALAIAEELKSATLAAHSASSIKTIGAMNALEIAELDYLDQLEALLARMLPEAQARRLAVGDDGTLVLEDAASLEAYRRATRSLQKAEEELERLSQEAIAASRVDLAGIALAVDNADREP